MWRTALVIVLVALVLASIPAATGQLEFNLQVGAMADDGSVGNIGVKADIRTHIYDVNKPDLADAFWVGNNLNNGSFIQFGYILQPGQYCLAGNVIDNRIICTGKTESIGRSDARWFWEYWPNASNPSFDFGTGQNQSAGQEGSWHNYEIMLNAQNGWSFIFDGRQVDNFSVHWAPSKDAAYMVAEKVTLSLSPGSLGPVAFRNLAYMKQDGWHNATALYAIVGCGVNPVCITNPYGVTIDAANQIIAGSDESQPANRDLLWSITEQQTNNANYAANKIYGTAVILALIAIVMSAVVVADRRKPQETKWQAQFVQTYCAMCGAKFEPNVRFCTNCGAKRESL